MPIRSILHITVVTIATQASAQLYWAADQLYLPPAVNTNDIGRSFASGNGRIYIAGTGNIAGTGGSSGVYEFNQSTNAYLRKFSSTGNTATNLFGWDMDFHNGLLLVGAPSQDTDRGRTGAAYLFNTTTGALVERLEADDGASSDFFGLSASIDGITALIGSPFAPSGVAGITGKVYVYRIDNFAHIISLTASPGSNDRDFGTAVAHNDQYAVVAAQNDISEEGVVYIFDFVTGAVLHRFTSPNARPFDGFGASLAIDGSTLMVGAQRGGSASAVGGAVFVYDLTTGSIVRTLTSNFAFEADAFGRSVDFNDDYIIVGASSDSQFGFGAGKIYLFRRDTYSKITEITSPNPFSGEAFGHVVSLESDVIISSSFRNGDPERDIFIIDQFCRADVNRDGTTDFFDISDFIKVGIDWNDDGAFDFFDVSEFLQSYLTPCP